MKQMQLHATSWGRIGLMLRVDYYEHRRTFFALLGIIALVILVGPHLPMFFLDDAFADASSMEYVGLGINGALRGLAIFAITIYSYYYIHHRIQHSSPIAFAQLPAKLWEKVASIALAVIAIHLAYWAVAILCEVFHWMTIPTKEYITLTIDWSIIGGGNVVHMNDGVVPWQESMMFLMTPIVVFLVNIIGWVVLTIGFSLFRNFYKGGLFSLIALGLGMWLVSGLGLVNLKYWFSYSDSIASVLPEPWSFADIKLSLVSLISLIAILGGCVWYLFRKLKTIQV